MNLKEVRWQHDSAINIWEGYIVSHRIMIVEECDGRATCPAAVSLP
jgi:hypothetical protein